MTPIPLGQFAEQLEKIFPVLMRGFARRQPDELIKGKITPQQFFILDFLLRTEAAKMTELANLMEVTTPAVTGIVDRLVRAGYVRRIFDPKDRRVVIITLKPKGLALVKRIHHDRHKMILEIFSQISADDRESYLRILNNIKDIVTQKK